MKWRSNPGTPTRGKKRMQIRLYTKFVLKGVEAGGGLLELNKGKKSMAKRVVGITATAVENGVPH